MTDWWVTKGTTFSGAWNLDHTILRGREELPFHHPNRWHFNRFRLWVQGSGIPPQCVSSLPVIKHNEESGRPFVGDSVEGTQSPNGTQSAVIVDSIWGAQTVEPNSWVWSPALPPTSCQSSLCLCFLLIKWESII